MADDCCDPGDACCTPPPLNLPGPKVGLRCGDSDACCAGVVDPSVSHYKRVLWAVLAVNSVMFAIEIGAGLMAGSASLQADALDFLGDAANYALSLMVVGMTLRARGTAALVKGISMGALDSGCWP